MSASVARPEEFRLFARTQSWRNDGGDPTCRERGQSRCRHQDGSARGGGGPASLPAPRHGGRSLRTSSESRWVRSGTRRARCARWWPGRRESARGVDISRSACVLGSDGSSVRHFEFRSVGVRAGLRRKRARVGGDGTAYSAAGTGVGVALGRLFGRPGGPTTSLRRWNRVSEESLPVERGRRDGCWAGWLRGCRTLIAVAGPLPSPVLSLRAEGATARGGRWGGDGAGGGDQAFGGDWRRFARCRVRSRARERSL